MRRRSIAVVLAVGTAAVTLAGCGGDDAEEALEEAATQAETVIEGATEEIAGATDAIDTATGEVGEALPEIAVDLAEQNGSGQSGTATFSVNDDGTLHVSIELSPPGAEPQPAHIHEGTCADLNPEPAYALEDVADGRSETDVDVSLDDLALMSYAVNVHESAAQADVYVACGDITDAIG
jgi:hypothetical protein